MQKILNGPLILFQSSTLANQGTYQLHFNNADAKMNYSKIVATFSILQPTAYNIPIKTTAHTTIAIITNTEGIPIKNGNATACDNFTVQTVYMPNGKTIPQYCGLYFKEIFFIRCRHVPKIIISGIHQVPIAQKNKVNPLRNGIIPTRNGHFSAFNISVAPARTEMASAPIFIQ